MLKLDITRINYKLDLDLRKGKQRAKSVKTKMDSLPLACITLTENKARKRSCLFILTLCLELYIKNSFIYCFIVFSTFFMKRTAFLLQYRYCFN